MSERESNRGAGRDKFAFVAFVFGLGVLAYVVGVATARYRLPPYGLISSSIEEIKTALDYHADRLPWQFFRYDDTPDTPDVVHDAAGRSPGATLISGFTGDEAVHAVRIVGEDGTVIQEWDLDWDDLWPGDAPHIPAEVMKRPQKHVHGVAMAENGDIVLNFTELATFRVNPCGKVVWRLDRRGHHSVDMGSDGSFWVPGIITHYNPDPRMPNYKPDFEEFTVMHVSADGKVLDEFSINQLLIDNGYQGLLYLSSLNEFTPIVTSDTLHVNDIEVLKDTMPEGVAKHGDILISLRNINTILLVDPETRKIKFVSTGKVQRQHDTDFIDGNTITVFDNHNLLPDWFDNASGQRDLQGQSSKVVTISLETGAVLDSIDTAGGEPFFTDLMGQQQQLPNGNLLVAEARAGRAFERAPDGHLVWEYFNIAGDDLLGAISYAQRLDPRYDADFFKAARAACGG